MRIIGIAAAVGCILVTWLFFSSPHVDFVGAGDHGKETLSCLPLGRVYADNGTDYRVLDRPLRADQDTYVSEYLSDEDESESESDISIDEFEHEQEQEARRKEFLTANMLATCEQARTNRQSQLFLVALLTASLAVVFFCKGGFGVYSKWDLGNKWDLGELEQRMWSRWRKRQDERGR